MVEYDKNNDNTDEPEMKECTVCNEEFDIDELNDDDLCNDCEQEEIANRAEQRNDRD